MLVVDGIKMVFIRTKNIKGHQYAYLVKNIWNEDSRKVKQITIKYLGNVSKLKINSIPKEYENNPHVKSFLSMYGKNKDYSNNKDFRIDEEINERFFTHLKLHEIESLVKIYDEYVMYHQLDSFYEKVMIPVLHRVGDLWASGKLDVVTEHICSNAALSLIKIINEKILKSRKNLLDKKILICTPQGELHFIGCAMMESLLLKKGFVVYNASPSTPPDSITSYLCSKEIDLLIISFTLAEHKKMVKKLVSEIADDTKIPIIIGGRGLSSFSNDKEFSNMKNVHILDKSVGKIGQLVGNLL